MWKNKWRVLVIASLLSVILLALLEPMLGWMGESYPDELPALLETFNVNVMLFSLYGFPFMFLYGFPVHLFASWLSERFGGRWRWVISLAIHATFGLLFFIEFLPLISALVFFAVGETVRYLQHEERKRPLQIFTNVAILVPVLIWTATGIPSWYNSMQIQAEMDRLRAVGHPQPELVIDQKAYPITVNHSEYSSHIEEEAKQDQEPPKIPEAFYDGMKTITVKPGEIVTIQYKNSPGEYQVRALHWENGNLLKENLTKAQLKAPTVPGIYGYSILSDWGRHISRSFFGLEVKAE